MAWPGRCDAGPSTGTTRVSPVERQRARAMDRNVPDPEFASRPAGDHNGSRGPLPQGGAMQSEVKRWIDTSVKGAKRGQGSDEQRPLMKNGPRPRIVRTLL